MSGLKKAFQPIQNICHKIIESKYFVAFSLFMIFLNLYISTQDVNDDDNVNSIYAFLVSSDQLFSIYFIFEAIISIIANTISWKRFNGFWTYFDIVVIIVNILFLAGLPNFSAIRLWSIFKYLPRIKWLRGINIIFRALRKSLPVIRDIVIFTVFIFIFSGILGVHMYGGKLKYRCLNDYGMVYDDEQICSTSSSGFQCPEGYNCMKTDENPFYNTVGFDNILYSILTIFQIITMEGWSDILFMTSDSSSYWGIFFYLIIIILGNWFILQLIVAVISNNLMDEIEEGEDENEEGNEREKISNGENENSEENDKKEKKKKNTFSKHIKKLVYGFVNSKIMLKLRRSTLVNFIQKILNFIMNNNAWDSIMLLIIIIDTVSTCLINKDTSAETRKTISSISDICTIIFAVEMVCKLIMLNPVGYVKQTFFNVMDGTFTILSVLDQFVIPSEQGFFIFRILRSLRVLRVSKYSKQFQYLFEVIKDSFKDIISLIIIWLMSVIIFATFGYQLFSGTMNFEEGVPDENFDTFTNSILSIIQLFTMENWNNIEASCVHARGIQYVLIPIIISIIGSFFLSNILVAIIIGAFQDKITEDQNTTDESNVPIQTLKFLKSTLGGFIDITKEGTGSLSFMKRFDLRKSKENNNCVVEINKSSPLNEAQQYPLSNNDLTEKQHMALTENLRIIENEISKGSQNLLENKEIDKLHNERRKIMVTLSKEGGIKGLYYKYRLSRCVELFRKVTESLSYNVIITIIIILSCAILYYDIPERQVINGKVVVIESSKKTKDIIYILNVIFGIFFIFEFILQAIAQGLIIDSNAYLRSPLNWIDLCVIIISVVGLFEFAENLLILRVFRLMRIIKLIKLSRELRIVTLAIWKTIPSLMTAIIPFMFYLLIASVIGLSLYTGDGYTCNDPNPNIESKENCTGVFYSSSWDREMDRSMWGYFVGYDNFFDSLQTSFVLSNQEGWPDIMYYFMGYGSDNEIRQPGINKWVSVYYILSIIVGSWIFLAVVTGIAYDSIKRNSDILKGINNLNSNQKKIHEYVSLLITSKPYKRMPSIKNAFHKKIRNFFESPYYDRTILFIIALNIFVLLLNHDDQSKFEDYLQLISEYGFLFIYVVEVILLFYAYGFKFFFSDNWRNLCLVIVVLSVLNVVVSSDLIKSNIFVSIRLIRMFRLIKFARSIQAIAQVVSTKYRQLLNIFFLMVIIMIAYAFIGCYYFGDINYENTDILNSHLNFSTFFKSLLSVFIFTTGENWPIAMADCVGRTIRFCVEGSENCGNLLSPFYFISLQIIINWILLNSFIAIIVDSFVMMLQEHDEIARMELVKQRFTDAWNKYDKDRKGFLPFKEFVDMYNDIEIPENFEWSNRKLKFFKTKPPISYLFKNLKVYYNICTYTDSLFCITSFWVNDELPLNVRNALWEHNGWNKIIQRKLLNRGQKISFSGDNRVSLKEVKFGVVYGIFLLQKKYKRSKSTDNLIGDNNNERNLKNSFESINKGSNDEFYDSVEYFDSVDVLDDSNILKSNDHKDEKNDENSKENNNNNDEKI
ncbi:hypothetical protein BCR32DRAFT_267543 [Anaeromyces robustus]|uniref:EF-hand domain-containing protein n=1 Tax=Anaeromyces robustus TaxID=1754192 RepID=A0A1Y1XA37_9FUNG|nr:hypothetical protein BCR32DRAFT_267543 [Anaeromyces robustus]|eukprot:ORX82612.1 hypothetical protein BCR32DRAFT_267543 [Anaeromyces robustus]